MDKSRRPSKRRRTARRKNPDFFSNATGVHPIRDPVGHREWATNSPKGKKLAADLWAKSRAHQRRLK